MDPSLPPKGNLSPVGPLARTAALIGGLLLGLAAAETAARLAWPWPESPRSGLAEDEELPVLDDFWDLARPNVLGINRGVLYRSNSRGLRGPELRKDPAAGVFRIAVAGDSTTVGSGVAEEDRYTSQLERRLNAENSDRRFEILNAGFNGLNVPEGVRRLERKLGYYSADLFVFGFSPNDIEGDAYEEFEENERARSWWTWALRQSQSPFYAWRLLSYRLAQFMGRNSWIGQTEELRHNYLENPAAWSDFLAGLDLFVALAREYDVCALVLMHVNLLDLGPDHPFLDIYDRVEQAAVERGLAVVQSFPYFQGRHPESLWVSPFDPHPNREGHTILAQALRDGLTRLPASCWEPKAGRAR